MRILIIRFSSIGDVLQTLSVVTQVRKTFPQAQIEMVTQSRFCDFYELHPDVHRVWSVPKSSGLGQLWKLSREVEPSKLTHVYDAHNNLRSRLFCFFLRCRWPFFKFLRRPIYRLRRFFLFQFRLNLFPQPFSGQMDQIRPLRKWGVSPEIPKEASLFLPDSMIKEFKEKWSLPYPFVALAPSAAYVLKRWPVSHWAQLIQESSHQNFVLLGGPEDSFLESLVEKAPDRVLNLAGQLSLLESATVVSLSQALISNDTGVMHMAEQLNHPCVALMGPAPFGFPSKPSTRILERQLSCRPCSKHGQGPCVNPEYQKCLRDISSEEVMKTMGSLEC